MRAVTKVSPYIAVPFGNVGITGIIGKRASSIYISVYVSSKGIYCAICLQGIKSPQLAPAGSVPVTYKEMAGAIGEFSCSVYIIVCVGGD